MSRDNGCSTWLFLPHQPLFGQTKPINLTFSTVFPPTHKMGTLAPEWAKELEKRTNGRVTARIHYGSTLIAHDKIFDG
jgi:TRAP-type C4-dicarboxylate transport system substrate-binding protein